MFEDIKCSNCEERTILMSISPCGELITEPYLICLKCGTKILAKEFIPKKTFYCYKVTGEMYINEEGTPCTKKIERCPFHRIIKDAPEQENGYCILLRKGDKELNEEITWTDAKTGEKINKEDVPFGGSLLWDSCKECMINQEIL